MQHVVMRASIILNKNIDVQVGVANGTTRLVTKFEFDFENNICNIFVAINRLIYIQIYERKHYKKKRFPRTFV